MNFSGLKNYTKAISLDDSKAKYYNDRGECFGFLDEWGNAFQDFGTASTMEESNVNYIKNWKEAFHRVSKK